MAVPLSLSWLCRTAPKRAVSPRARKRGKAARRRMGLLMRTSRSPPPNRDVLVRRHRHDAVRGQALGQRDLGLSRGRAASVTSDPSQNASTRKSFRTGRARAGVVAPPPPPSSRALRDEDAAADDVLPRVFGQDLQRLVHARPSRRTSGVLIGGERQHAVVHGPQRDLRRRGAVPGRPFTADVDARLRRRPVLLAVRLHRHVEALGRVLDLQLGIAERGRLACPDRPCRRVV